MATFVFGMDIDKMIFTTLLGMVCLKVLQAGLKSWGELAGMDIQLQLLYMYYSTDNTNHAMAWM